MRIKFVNARILTMKDNQDVFEGELIVNEGFIEEVGERVSNDGKFDEVIDCGRNLLMPGFKNAHTHSGMSVLRSLADDLPLDKWLNESIFPVEARMSDDDIYEMTKLSVLEYLTSGITACFDMYLTPYSIAKAMDEMGFRCVQTGAVNNFSQSPELLEECYLNLNQDKSLQSFVLGFHAEYTTSPEIMKKIADLANKYKAPIYVHMAETKSEVAGCIERYNMTPLKYMDSIGMFNYGGGIYHGVYLTDEEMDIMKKHNMFEVTNPASNLKLASGIAPIAKYMDKDIPVAIGTDGPASNNCLDMFREMFLVTGLAKIKEGDAMAVDAKEVLKMATVNGAKCMRLDNCDILDAGKCADIIMINLDMPNMQPINNIVKNIVYSGSKINVMMTMINGNILYKDGKFMNNIDEHQIYSKVAEIKERLLKNE